MQNLTHGFITNPYKFIIGKHHNNDVIWIDFPYQKQWVDYLKSKTKARWSSTNKKWYVYDTPYHRNLFGLPAKKPWENLIKQVEPINQPALQNFIGQLILKGYSTNTIRCYTNEFSQLLKTIKTYPVNQLTADNLRSYFLYCTNNLKLSDNMIHSRMNAIKFYFEQVIKREKLFLDIPRPKKPSLLPKALSKNDIKKMLSTIDNIKHELLLKMAYGMGLRVSELVNLKISDIDSKRMQVLISQSKGKKDRYVNLPESLLHLLRKYYIQYKPKYYLFEGQNSGKYSVRSVQQVFKNAMKKAKINKKIGIHGLRHSYATHLIEQGTDIRFVQELLGHKDLKTTMIYTGLTDLTKRKIKSPLDNL